MKTHTKIASSLLFAAMFTLPSLGYADNASKPSKPLTDIQKAISATLQTARPNIVVQSVEASPLPGLYKVSFEGAQDIYATADGKHFMTGDLFNIHDGDIINLTESGRNKERALAIASVDKKDMITFSPKGEVKKKMFVFTDIDCGYCQLLHSKMAEYNAMGIEVSYLGYPRAGLGSDSFKKLASAWCDANPQEALTKLKQKIDLPDNICATNPIAKQYGIGQKIGLTGTPAIILEDGELISGYLPPEKMKERFKL